MYQINGLKNREMRKGELFELAYFLMFCMLATGAAILRKNDLFGSVGFVSLGDIVEMPAFGAF